MITSMLMIVPVIFSLCSVHLVSFLMPLSRPRFKQRGKGAPSDVSCRGSSEFSLLPPADLSLKPGLLDPPDVSPDVLLAPHALPTDCSSIQQSSEWIRDLLFKTKACRYFIEGRCKYGDKCTYAHSTDELQARPDLRKTRICYKLDCTDDSCPFAHSIYELRDPPISLELAPCRAYPRGRPNDADCLVFHDKARADHLKTPSLTEDSGMSRAPPEAAPTLAPPTSFGREPQRASLAP